MDAKDLPARPHLEQYKKQAKELVKAWKAGDVEAIQRVRKNHPRFGGMADDDVSGRAEDSFRGKKSGSKTAALQMGLGDAQWVIAREHGFESWAKFAKHVWAAMRERAVATLSNPLAAFITAACVPRDASHASGTLENAEAILAAHPEIAKSDIHAAAILGDETAVRRLLKHDGRNATAKGGPYGWDALTHLCFSRYLRLDRGRSAELLRAATALLDAGASAKTGFWEMDHQPKPEWESVLYGAAGVAHHAGLARLLLERGADPNDEETPYHAPETYDNDALKVLVESGKLSEQSLATMLLRKADWHDEEGMKYLLEHGADPNRMTSWHYTALHQAVRRDNGIEKIEMLLEHGADPLLKNLLDGRPATLVAARRGRGDILDAFERRGIRVEFEGVERLIAACARNDGKAVQSIAASEQHLVRELLAEGGTLLAEFAGVGNTDGVRLLLDLGINVGELYEKGDAYFDIAPKSTALHVAAWHAWPSTVGLLIERGAAIDVLDGKGRTPLALAVRACVDSYWTHRRSSESVERLLRAGAGVSGVEYPCGYAEVDELLRRYGKKG
jgi:ankyrin repeat protein